MFLAETCRIIGELEYRQVDAMLRELRNLRARGGRLFFVGNGGGAGHASHAAADFRKIGGIESYAWGENVSDLTAYANDVSWDASTARWLEDSRFGHHDALFVFSVGGASDSVSANLKWAMSYAYGLTILGIVGANGGEVARYATAHIQIPSTSTPQVEGIQAVLWHMLVTEL